MPEEIKTGLLAGDIDYQEGSIVSKQIVKNANGNITLFAFSRNENLTEHTSPYDALVFVAEGEMEIKLGGVPYDIKTGEYILMPANIPHALKAVVNSKMLLTMIK